MLSSGFSFLFASLVFSFRPKRKEKEGEGLNDYFPRRGRFRCFTVYFIDRRHCVKLYFCYDKYVLQTSGGTDAGDDRNNYIGVCEKDRG